MEPKGNSHFHRWTVDSPMSGSVGTGPAPSCVSAPPDLECPNDFCGDAAFVCLQATEYRGSDEGLRGGVAWLQVRAGRHDGESAPSRDRCGWWSDNTSCRRWRSQWV